MLKGQILHQVIYIIELHGEERLSYSYNFTATLISEYIDNPIQQVIEAENWRGYITFWSFLYINAQGRYYYKCNFCSRFELLNGITKFDIYENLCTKEIIEAILDDAMWCFIDGLRHPYLVQYQESNLNLIKYLSYLDNFAYFERNNKIIFTDKPYLFTQSIDMEFSNVKQSNTNVINSVGFEASKKDPITEIYGFNIDRPNDILYTQSGIQKNAEYWSEALSIVECKERLNKVNKNNIVYRIQSINPQLRVGDTIVLSKHKLAGKYYITRIKHIYTQNSYNNQCEMLALEDVYCTSKIQLNSPQGLQIATVSSTEQGRVKLRFQWSRKLMQIPTISATAGKDYGTIIMPKRDEKVVVAFESPFKAFMLGSIYDSFSNITKQTGYVFHSQDETGSTQLAIKDKSSLLTIETSGEIKALSVNKATNNKTEITLNKNECRIKTNQPDGRIVIKNVNTEVIISSNQVSIKAPTVKICAEEIDIQANTILIKTNEISFLVNQQMLLKAAIITMKAFQNTSISSAAINFYTNILNTI